VAISSVEVVPYALPFKEPYVTARGTLERREMVLLRVRDEDRVEGLGEAVPLSLRGGASLAEVVSELERFGEQISGRPELDDGRVAGMADAMLSRPGSCAVQTALLDLSARTSGEIDTELPLLREPVRCNATLVAGEAAKVAEEAAYWAGDGFTSFKLKLGREDDAGQVRAVRGALGTDAKIRVDVNGAWDLESAKRALAELEAFDIEFAEEPVSGLEALAQLSAATAIPIAADESVSSREEAEQAKRVGACRLIGVKLSKVGGPHAARDVACALPTFVSSALDGPVGIAASALTVNQICQSEIPGVPGDAGVAHGLATQRLFAETIASVECELRGDMLHLPEGPGLGVEIDDAALERHRL
jgi:muconate cycloisomerase